MLTPEFLLKFKAILFDLDGTLVDSEPLKAEALALAMNHFGSNVPKETYKKVMGQSWEIVLNEFFTRGKKEVPQLEFNPVFRKHYQDLVENRIEFKSGLRELFTLAKKHGLKLAVVSSASQWMVTLLLGKLGLLDLFNLVVTGQDVKNHKPDPEAYILALSKLKISPSDALIFEDSESGIRAALEAKVGVIAVRHDYNQSHDFSGSLFEVDNFQLVQSSARSLVLTRD